MERCHHYITEGGKHGNGDSPHVAAGGLQRDMAAVLEGWEALREHWFLGGGGGGRKERERRGGSERLRGIYIIIYIKYIIYIYIRNTQIKSNVNT